MNNTLNLINLQEKIEHKNGKEEKYYLCKFKFYPEKYNRYKL